MYIRAVQRNSQLCISRVFLPEIKLIIYKHTHTRNKYLISNQIFPTLFIILSRSYLKYNKCIQSAICQLCWSCAYNFLTISIQV